MVVVKKERKSRVRQQSIYTFLQTELMQVARGHESYMYSLFSTNEVACHGKTRENVGQWVIYRTKRGVRWSRIDKKSH